MSGGPISFPVQFQLCFAQLPLQPLVLHSICPWRQFKCDHSCICLCTGRHESPSLSPSNLDRLAEAKPMAVQRFAALQIQMSPLKIELLRPLAVG